MKQSIAGILFGTMVSVCHPCELERYEFAEPHMGTMIRLVFYARGANVANQAAKMAFARVGQLDNALSNYRRESELMRLCRSSDTMTAAESRSTVVSDDLWQVLCAAQQLSRETDGAFDVTVGPLTRVWRRARRRGELPPVDEIAAAKKSVGYQYVILNKETRSVRLERPEMRFDLGGIAKGYVADQALAALRRSGIDRALVDAGGDLSLGDPPPARDGWIVGVAPLAAGAEPSCHLLLRNRGVATSGDTWQYLELDGKRYSHILDPRTGIGLTQRIAVTVVARDGMSADGLASAVSILGPEKGIVLVNEIDSASALVVTMDSDVPRTLCSSSFAKLPRSEP